MRVLASIVILAVILTAVITGVVLGSKHIFAPVPLVIQGEADATQIEVAPKLFGRVETIHIKRGDAVTKDQVLVTLKSPEVEAKLTQATGLKEAAAAQAEKADNGARKEEIEMAYQAWQMAEAGVEVMEKTYKRVAALYETDAAPIQQLDEVTAKYKAAVKGAQASKARYDMAVNGARYEDKNAAHAVEKQAGGVVSEVESYVSETHMKSPIDGEVVDVMSDPGELVTPGFPVISIVDLTDVWLTFNLREDLLSDIRMGGVFKAKIPALEDKVIEVKVEYMKAMGDYATWRATKTAGDFDMKTFEVRARPTAPVEGLRPGMTAVVLWRDPAHPEAGVKAAARPDAHS
jgi:HlyD family secretion protein